MQKTNSINTNFVIKYENNYSSRYAIYYKLYSAISCKTALSPKKIYFESLIYPGRVRAAYYRKAKDYSVLHRIKLLGCFMVPHCPNYLSSFCSGYIYLPSFPYPCPSANFVYVFLFLFPPQVPVIPWPWCAILPGIE